MIADASERAAVSLGVLANEAGLDRRTLCPLRDGTRQPTPGDSRALADALERRRGELVELAEQLRREASE